MSISRPNIKKLDAIWALTVKEKAGYKCEHCGNYDSQQEAAHVVGRRHRSTRWGMEFELRWDLCGHCLCHVCHQNYDEHGPLEPAIVETIGKERQERIMREATRSVAKGQEYDVINQILEDIRDANDDSPYSKEKAQTGDNVHQSGLFPER